MLHMSIPVYTFLKLCIYSQTDVSIRHKCCTHTDWKCYACVQFGATTFDHKYMINCTEFIELSNIIYLYIRRVLQYVSHRNIGQ
jgi:hypothetical protein